MKLCHVVRNLSNPATKPVVLAALEDHILASHNTYQRPGLEADDVLGILATSEKILPHTPPVTYDVVWKSQPPVQ